MKKIIGLTIIYLILFSSPIKLEKHKLDVLEKAVKNNNIDINSKSILGWERLLSEPDKCKEYNYKFDKEERKILLEFIKIFKTSDVGSNKPLNK